MRLNPLQHALNTTRMPLAAPLVALALLVACDTPRVGPRGPEGPQGPPGASGGGATSDAGDEPDAPSRDTDSEPDAATAPCPEWTAPPGLGGAADAEVSLDAADRWKAFRAAREQERMLEAWDPARVTRRYRVEQRDIAAGCVSTDALIDLGRGLFLRSFTLAEGLGNDLGQVEGSPAGRLPRPNMRRLQQGHFGGPDATSCANCHWKGGFAGGGDHTDNMYILGDGDDLSTHDARNPPTLWGAGWAELVAREMTAALHAQRDQLRRDALDSGEPATVALQTHGVRFGALTATPTGDEVTFDTSAVEGIDPDLVIKPFGWKGVFSTLRHFVRNSLHVHMGLQPEELLAHPDPETDPGNGPDPDDPDHDGVTREFTEGQLTALVLFLATLDAPLVEVPTASGVDGPPYSGEFNLVDGQEMTFRWLDGSAIFTGIGCDACHVPVMAIRASRYTTQARVSGESTSIDLAIDGARPLPTQRDDGVWLVPTFSDFKRHRMGDRLAGRHAERGVAPDVYMTRRLWGLAGSAPYLHDGSAILLDEAIAMHGGEGSEARGQAEAFMALSERDKASLRVFLRSLRRAPTIRVR